MKEDICSVLVKDLNSEPESLFNPSIFMNNKICVKLQSIEEKLFELLIFDEKTNKLIKKIELSKYLIESINPNSELLNIVPGMHKNELIFFFSDGIINSAKFSLNKNEKSIIFNNSTPLMNLNKKTNLFLNSHMFLPLYQNNSFIGVIISNDIINNIESYWIFLIEDEKLIEIPFDAFYVKIFPQTPLEPLSILAVDENSIIIFQINSNRNFNLADITFEIPLEVKLPRNIISGTYNNKILSLWTKDQIFRYSTEFGFYKDNSTIKNEIKEIITYLNQKYIVYIQNEKIFRLDLSTGNTIQPTFIDSNYKQLKLKLEGNIKVYIFVDGLAFLILDQNHFYFFYFFEDNTPVYFLQKYEKLQKPFFKLLENYPEEIKQKYLSAFSKYSEIYNSQLESLSAKSYIIYKPKKFLTKEMDREILEHLHVDQSFHDLAKKFEKTEVNFILYVINNFGITRCKFHNKFQRNCDLCKEKLMNWRADGLKKIKSKSYRKSALDSEIISYSSKIRNEFQLSESRRTLRLGFSYMVEIQSKIEISDDLFEDAFKIYSECVKNKFIRGRSIKEFVGASIYAIFRINRNPLPIKIFLELLSISRKGLFKSYKLITKDIFPILKIKKPESDPKDYINMIVKELKLSDSLKNAAKSLLKIAKEKGFIFSGKDPKGLAAGSIYLLTNRLGEKRTQKEICQITKITEVTLRIRVKELKQYIHLLPSVSRFQSHTKRRDNQNSLNNRMNEITVPKIIEKTKRPQLAKIREYKQKSEKKSLQNIINSIPSASKGIQTKLLPIITTKSILKALDYEWQTEKKLHCTMKINDKMDARFLLIKLKELKRKGEILSNIENGNSQWKLIDKTDDINTLDEGIEGKRPLSELKNFLDKKMKMKHVYQPLIIKILLESNGVCNLHYIAEKLAQIYDNDINYYKQRILLNPIPVLKYHNIIISHSKNIIELRFDLSNIDLVKEIINVCNIKIKLISKIIS